MSASDQADVVVIGGGLAGFAAALSAAEAGADVVLLEKQPDFGGSTVLSGGFLAFAGTDMQEAAGVADSEALLMSDLMNAGGGANDERLVRAYVGGQAELYRWLVGHGVRFDALELGSGQSVPRGHITRTRDMIDALRAAAIATGRVRTLTGSAAGRLVREGGRVRAVALAGEGDGRIEARRGVVIASGGFSRSEDLLATFAPNQTAALRIGGAGNVGDGLRMAMQLGAGLADMGQIKGTFGTHPTTGSDRHELLLAYYAGAIIVNREGRRFVDESLTYKILGEACLKQPGHVAFQVWDQPIQDLSQEGVPLYDFVPALEAGKILRADTLEELARLCDIDPAALVRTVADYNADVPSGLDSAFGRDGLSNHHGALRPIATPPFYAYPSTSVVLATYCGLTIDPQAQVVDVFGEPIDGLYAAGEVTGGFHGVTYVTGSSLGKAAYFGRVAGRTAAGANAAG